ncbi:hypothetical protein AB1Y20_006859 [Prymnesium parvum]|uniref:Uncharacterized protein n=1 Tax=Prymnesium parvum TaxID=97485 RepID=A0AB34IZ78_PRYPA
MIKRRALKSILREDEEGVPAVDGRGVPERQGRSAVGVLAPIGGGMTSQDAEELKAGQRGERPQTCDEYASVESNHRCGRWCSKAPCANPHMDTGKLCGAVVCDLCDEEGSGCSRHTAENARSLGFLVRFL